MIFENLLKKEAAPWPKRGHPDTLQVNLGRLCNMACTHCHVNAGPTAREVMSLETANLVISFLFKYHIKTLDLTGGAPEMAPCFRSLAMAAKDLVDEIIVRCNLTVLFEEKMEWLPDFYQEIDAHIVASLPCYTRENVDRQRGKGTFDRSIEALKLLNDAGFGIDGGMRLDLVYNPGGAFLSGNQRSLEESYRRVLGEEYQIAFNNLFTITNMPVNRFGGELKRQGAYDEYLSTLKEGFNPLALDNIMCKELISVGWDGQVYDCDFNQALNMPVTDSDGRPLKIGSFDPVALVGREIQCHDHCLACVAGEGSSCGGSLV